MIRHYFGLDKTPFDTDNIQLLPHQENILKILDIHAQIGGLSVIIGEPGTGKSIIKDAIYQKRQQVHCRLCRKNNAHMQKYYPDIMRCFSDRT